MAKQNYFRTTVHVSADPVTLVASLAKTWSDSTEPFVVYEEPDTVSFGAGVLAEITVDAKSVQYRYNGITTTTRWQSSPLSQLDEISRNIPIEDWNGYGTVDFEFAAVIAGVCSHSASRPLIRLIVPQSEVRIDRDGRATLRATSLDGLRVLHELVTAPVSRTEPACRDAGLDMEHLKSATSEDNYREQVTRAVDDIRAGRLDKVILSRRVEVPFAVDLIATYRNGRRHNTPARSFLLSLDGLRAAGFSPEIVMQTESNDIVRTQPLAGTRAHVQDPATNTELNRELYSNPKEIYEHAISVKLACDELESLCLAGSVRVSEFMRTKNRGTVQHLGSQVDGRLVDGVGPWSALGVLFPSVTASGIPKRSALERIAAIEGRGRELYAGAVFTLNSSGGMDAALVLRTLFESQGTCWMQAGAGIVSDSTPERESTETLEKMQSVSRYLVRATKQQVDTADANVRAAG